MNKDRILNFTKYIEEDVLPAVAELETVEEASRKHIQKLVYTNLVDRFDSTVDHCFLENALDNRLFPILAEKLTDPIPEGVMLKILSSEETKNNYISGRIKSAIRNEILRDRHSKKVRKLMETFSENENLDKPRVNPSRGQILNTYGAPNKSIPSSILGYADWLYSRRNAVVHGGGKKLLKHDIDQIKSLYRCDVSENLSFKLNSIKIAANFYNNLVMLITD
jgi:hypothetical protein